MPAPVGGGFVAEEVLAHVVVDADDVEPLAAKNSDRFGADQASRASDQSQRTYQHGQDRLERGAVFAEPGEDVVEHRARRSAAASSRTER